MQKSPKIRVLAMPSHTLHAMQKAGLLMLLALGLYVMLISSAFALNETVSPMGTVLCNVAAFFYGNLGRGLATLAVITLGIGGMLGKVSWGLAVTVGVGIAVVFNAPSIVAALGGGIAGGCVYS